MALKQMEKPDEALKRNWLPDDPRIWAHSKMLNPHEKQELTFTAPEKPGTYPYVCTFPGHAMTMRGELKVAPQAEGLKDLQFALYLGNWKQLPDFAKLTPHRTGKVEDNRIGVKLDDYKNEFGVVFTGRIEVSKKGSHRFYLASDDGARILVDGKMVVESDGIHPASSIKEGAIVLDKGPHEFRLEYFQAAGNIELYAAYKSAASQITPLMLPALQEYLARQSFAETPALLKPQPGVAVRAYENGEFRVHIVNERNSELYVQVAPVAKPEERRFLSGVVAFLTGDDAATRDTGQYAQWLTEHHSALVTFFSASPEGEAQRARYSSWEREFASREQARLAAAAAATKAEPKAWWRFW